MGRDATARANSTCLRVANVSWPIGASAILPMPTHLEGFQRGRLHRPAPAHATGVTQTAWIEGWAYGCIGAQLDVVDHTQRLEQRGVLKSSRHADRGTAGRWDADQVDSVQCDAPGLRRTGRSGN